MYIVLAKALKAPVTQIISPIVNLLVKLKISANSISICGVIGSSVCAYMTLPNGHFLSGAILISFFALFDLFDGAVARVSGSVSSRKGAVLDSTLDRIGDYLILFFAYVYFHNRNDLISWLLIVNMFLGFLIPYVRARAEANGIECSVGIAERSERLILVLIGFAALSFGAQKIFELSLWLLTVASVITVFQRFIVVAKIDQQK